MKALVLPAALALVAAVGLSGRPAAADDFASHVAVTARQAKGALEVVLAPKPGWTVNTAYPGIEVTLTPPPGVKLGKTRLTHHEVKYEDTHPGDHAGKAVFTTSVEGKRGSVIQGHYKMVICSASTCSPPFHGSFSVTLQAPGA